MNILVPLVSTLYILVGISLARHCATESSWNEKIAAFVFGPLLAALFLAVGAIMSREAYSNLRKIGDEHDPQTKS